RAALRSSSLRAAHRAIAVGPEAPASTAINATTTTEARGCFRLIEDRGSSNSWRYASTSSSPNRRESAIDHPHAPPGEAAWRWSNRILAPAQAVRVRQIYL